MVDIFDEVDEDLRAERAQRLLTRYGGLMFAGAVAVIAVVGGYQGWRWWQNKQDIAAATVFVTEQNIAASPSLSPQARTAVVTNLDTLAASAPDGYRILARMRAAALMAESGDVAGATERWDEVAGDAGADRLLRDLASLLWAQSQIDNGDPALLEARLKPLTAPDNAWRPLASEQLALLALRQGHTDAARDMFRALSADSAAPQGLRGRAAVLLGRLDG